MRQLHYDELLVARSSVLEERTSGVPRTRRHPPLRCKAQRCNANSERIANIEFPYKEIVLEKMQESPEN
jgi:hypothetical protein